MIPFASLVCDGIFRANRYAQARRAIAHGNKLWVGAFLTSDADLLASLFDDEGVVLSASGERTAGREAIRESFSGLMKRIGPTETNLRTANIWLEDDDLAVETGTFLYRYVCNNGGEQRVRGKYVVDWKRQPNGTWKIRREVGLPD